MSGPKSAGKYHTPVMLDEVLKGLSCKAASIYVDATIGGGGHAEAILRATSPTGQLVGLDCDDDAITEVSKKLSHFKHRVILIKTNFASLSRALDGQGVKSVDGILVDLGVSSHQLNTPERGFSFLRRGPLDMRMDPGLQVSAAELVNTASEMELANWFYKYGEDRYAKRIARHLCLARRKKEIVETTELAKLVAGAVPANVRRGKIHPATRVFQALRIVVNAELRNLEMFLGIAPLYLKQGGRLVVISYHSLEDRLVKERFNVLGEEGFSIITKKPLTPTAAEIKKNPSARSAKMRVLERL